MATDPALAYSGPESRSIAVTAILYSGAAVQTRGTVGNFNTSAGEAGAAFAEAGPILWIAFDGDPDEIESCQYVEPGTDRAILRRVTKRERVSAIWNTVKVYLSIFIIAALTQDFSLDFDPRDFG